MRIVTFKQIQDYAAQHPDADMSLRNWYKQTKECEWSCFEDVQQTFGTVEDLGYNLYAFNIKGNGHRLVAIIIFASKKVYVRFIGTRKEFDKIDDWST